MSVTTCAQEIARDAAGFRPASSLPDKYWRLIETYRAALMNQALAILGNFDDAEDVVQETFCDALRGQSKLMLAQSIGAWLRSLNRGNALNRLRTRRGESARSSRKQQYDPDRTLTTGGFVRMDVHESVARAIEKLPDDLRSVVILKYWEHLPNDEIARRLEISGMTARRRLYEASTHLFKILNVQFPAQARPGAAGRPGHEGASA